MTTAADIATNNFHRKANHAPLENDNEVETYHDDHVEKIAASSPLSIRLAARAEELTSPTSGLAPSKIQANLLVLPSRYATDFRQLCERNPVPCPLLAESSSPGSYDSFRSHIPGVSDENLFTGSVDVRTDIPRYNIYECGDLVESGCTEIKHAWTDDSVAFLIGCSFSFDAALTEAGLTPRHIEKGRNVPMYRTNIPLNPSGVFQGSKYVVSMRPYKRKDIEKVRDITRPFILTHGEPISWGWDAVERLGIRDIDAPDFGDATLTADGRHFGEARNTKRSESVEDDEDEKVPVFWGCGVTPQEAVMRAGKRIKGKLMGHKPGHMLVLDLFDDQIKQVA